MTQLERLLEEVDALTEDELQQLGEVVLGKLEASGIYMPRTVYEERWADEAIVRLQRYDEGRESAGAWTGVSRRSGAS